MKSLLLFLLSCCLMHANAQKGIQRWVLKNEAKQLSRQFNVGQKLKIEWFDSTGAYELKARLVDFRADGLVVRNAEKDTIYLPGKQISSISIEQKRHGKSRAGGAVAVAAGVGGMVVLAILGIGILMIWLAYVLITAAFGEDTAKDTGCLASSGSGCIAGTFAMLAFFGLGFWLLSSKTVKTEHPFSTEWVLEKPGKSLQKPADQPPKPIP